MNLRKVIGSRKDTSSIEQSFGNISVSCRSIKSKFRKLELWNEVSYVT